MSALMQSLNKWELISWADKDSFMSINDFEKSKNNISFEYWVSRGDFYFYYKENWEDKFLNELDNQFLIKCKELNNEN